MVSVSCINKPHLRAVKLSIFKCFIVLFLFSSLACVILVFDLISIKMFCVRTLSSLVCERLGTLELKKLTIYFFEIKFVFV